MTMCGADLVIFLSQQNLLPAVKQQRRELSVTLMYQRTHDQSTAYVRQLQLRFHYSISLHTYTQCTNTQCSNHPSHSVPSMAQCTIYCTMYQLLHSVPSHGCTISQVYSLHHPVPHSREQHTVVVLSGQCSYMSGSVPHSDNMMECRYYRPVNLSDTQSIVDER